MKKIYSVIFILLISCGLSAQCFVQATATNVTCFGNCDGTATAYPVGMTQPITYAWSPSGQSTQTAVGLCAGQHYVVVTDTLGCVATAVVTVGSPTQLQALITSYQDASCQSCCDGYAIGSASGGTPGYTYLWTPTNQTSATAQSLCVGTYTLCVTDMNGCVSCDTVNISFASSVQDQASASDVNVWGTDGVFSLTSQFPSAVASEVVVTNSVGAVVWRQQFGTATNVNTTIDLKNQAKGLYLVSVVTESGVTTRRIVNQ